MGENKMVLYWQRTAEKDYETMKNLYASGDYHWALFVGHLVIEKLLKGIYVKRKGENAIVPRIHNLVTLANKASIVLDRRQTESLDLITSFNLEARYPEYKQSFYEICL